MRDSAASPQEWELAGWCWLIGVKCDYDCDWNWRQRSGSRSSRKERCLARAYGATSSRPTTGPTRWPRSASSPGLLGPGLPHRGGTPAPSHPRGLAESTCAHYSYTHSVWHNRLGIPQSAIGNQAMTMTGQSQWSRVGLRCPTDVMTGNCSLDRSLTGGQAGRQASRTAAVLLDRAHRTMRLSRLLRTISYARS